MGSPVIGRTAWSFAILLAVGVVVSIPALAFTGRL